jgi:hypothetical protein
MLNCAFSEIGIAMSQPLAILPMNGWRVVASRLSHVHCLGLKVLLYVGQVLSSRLLG